MVKNNLFVVPVLVSYRVKFELNADNIISAVVRLNFHVRFVRTSPCSSFGLMGRKQPCGDFDWRIFPPLKISIPLPPVFQKRFSELAILTGV